MKVEFGMGRKGGKGLIYIGLIRGPRGLSGPGWLFHHLQQTLGPVEKHGPAVVEQWLQVACIRWNVICLYHRVT